MVQDIDKVTYFWIDRVNNGWCIKVNGYTKTGIVRSDGTDEELYVTLAYSPTTDDELLAKVEELLGKQKEENKITKKGGVN